MKRFLLIPLVVALAACGPSTGGSSTGQLGDVMADGTSTFVVVDLVAGTVRSQAAVADLGTNPRYRDDLLVFRRVGSGANQVLIAVFELTQAQWQRIDGSTPWTLVDARVVAASGYATSNRPAYNLSYDDVEGAFATVALQSGARLAIPTAAQWLTASGINAGWTWGSALDRSTLQGNAVVREGVLDNARMSGDIDIGGPLPVGTRAASPTGIYDLHGNVWEWVAPGEAARGGSWHDSVMASRVEITATRNGSGVNPALDHALIGVRPILVP